MLLRIWKRLRLYEESFFKTAVTIRLMTHITDLLVFRQHDRL